jgi:hypothetical protein
MLKTYTITQEGKSNGNTISNPFTIEIHKMDYVSAHNSEVNQLVVHTCTKNGSNHNCSNDDIESVFVTNLPAMTSSKNSDLSDFETMLQEKYPNNWA